MTNIIAQVDCGNSPKKEFLKDFVIALAKADREFVLGSITEDIQWKIVGQVIYTNKEQFIQQVQQQPIWKVEELRVEAVVTHGTDASVSGRVLTATGARFAFCHVLKFKAFKGALIKKLQTFIMEEKEGMVSSA